MMPPAPFVATTFNVIVAGHAKVFTIALPDVTMENARATITEVATSNFGFNDFNIYHTFDGTKWLAPLHSDTMALFLGDAEAIRQYAVSSREFVTASDTDTEAAVVSDVVLIAVCDPIAAHFIVVPLGEHTRWVKMGGETRFGLLGRFISATEGVIFEWRFQLCWVVSLALYATIFAMRMGFMEPSLTRPFALADLFVNFYSWGQRMRPLKWLNFVLSIAYAYSVFFT